MFDYEALCAKCRAAYGMMLKRGDYAHLASSPSLVSLCERLSGQHGYSDAFSGIDIKAVNRSYIEYAASYRYFDFIVRLSAFAKGKQARFLRRIAEEYEIKYLVRALYFLSSHDGGVFTAVPDYIRKYSRLDFTRITAEGSYDGVISALSGTPYHSAAIAELSKENPNISALEALWYGEYYERLYGEYTEDLDTKSREAVRELYRKRSDEKKDEVRKRMEKYGFSEEQALAVGLVCEPDGKNNRRSRNENGIYDECVRILHRGQKDMSTAVALLMTAETESRNIIHITEGIRYGVSPDAIMEKVICR